MSEIYNLTDWNIKVWLQTGGTRNKCFVENPESNIDYFFKESLDRYPDEFWSEIISSKIGKQLNFNLLDYNIGIYKNTVGCISKSMIDLRTEELEHGINLIKNSVPGFVVTDRPEIYFSDVEKSFNGYPGFIEKFIDVVIFDTIIGNLDRHSENWAIIRSLDINNERYNTQKFAIKAYEFYKRTGLRLRNIPFRRFFLKYMIKENLLNIKFSPIYDSGSSLGREIFENKIQRYLQNDQEVMNYLDKGFYEIRWEKGAKKITHFELLKKIMTNYNEYVSKRIREVLKKYNRDDIEQIIEKIDQGIPAEFEETKLSLQRKRLMVKLVDFRIKKLKELDKDGQV